MKFLIGYLGVTRRNRLHNKIRMCLEIHSLNEKVDAYREAWKGYIERMEETRISKKILRYTTRKDDERLEDQEDGQISDRNVFA